MISRWTRMPGTGKTHCGAALAAKGSHGPSVSIGHAAHEDEESRLAALYFLPSYRKLRVAFCGCHFCRRALDMIGGLGKTASCSGSMSGARLVLMKS